MIPGLYQYVWSIQQEKSLIPKMYLPFCQCDSPHIMMGTFVKLSLKFEDLKVVLFGLVALLKFMVLQFNGKKYKNKTE